MTKNNILVLPALIFALMSASADGTFVRAAARERTQVQRR